MNTLPSLISPTVQAHKRQLAWQILVPFLLVTVLILAAAILVAFGSASAARTSWADVSIIWLIAPMLVFALFFAVLLGGLIYAIARLLQVTPRYTGKAQGYFALFAAYTRLFADAAARPFVWVHQTGAVIRSVLKQ